MAPRPGKDPSCRAVPPNWRFVPCIDALHVVPVLLPPVSRFPRRARAPLPGPREKCVGGHLSACRPEPAAVPAPPGPNLRHVRFPSCRFRSAPTTTLREPSENNVLSRRCRVLRPASLQTFRTATPYHSHLVLTGIGVCDSPLWLLDLSHDQGRISAFQQRRMGNPLKFYGLAGMTGRTPPCAAADRCSWTSAVWTVEARDPWAWNGPSCGSMDRTATAG